MIDKLLGNLEGMMSQLSKSMELNEEMKNEAMSKLSEEDRQYIQNVEKVAKKFTDSGDLSGLMNYLNSVQQKAKENASTNRD
jgi:hypothetical protein